VAKAKPGVNIITQPKRSAPSKGGTTLFFFHADDGIRDRNVTGVQTCALPISRSWPSTRSSPSPRAPWRARTATSSARSRTRRGQIGRASCRERVSIAELAEASTKKNVILADRLAEPVIHERHAARGKPDRADA